MQLRKHGLGLASVVVLASSLAASTSAQGGPPPPATNILYGFLNTNRTLTFTAPGPVYYIVGDLVVDAAATLTIEPGVTVVFEANRDTLQGGDYPGLSELQVNGSLVADASTGDSIKFVSSAGGLNEWGQVKVSGGAQCTIKRCALRGAVNGLYTSGTATVANVSVYGNSNGITSNGHLTLDTAVLDGLSTAVSVAGDGSVQHLVITGALIGIDASSFTGVIRECAVRGRPFNGGTGLFLGPNSSTLPSDSTNVKISTVSGFTTGVSLRNGAVARNLLLYGNGIGFNGDNSNTQVVYCTSVNNSSDGVRANFSSRVYSSIVALNGGVGLTESFGCQGYANYVDVWSNSGGASNGCFLFGSKNAAFSPFFVNPASGDYDLAAGSVFKTYGPWGAEIGAYGPGPGSPVPAHLSSWGKVKATYR